MLIFHEKKNTQPIKTIISFCLFIICDVYNFVSSSSLVCPFMQRCWWKVFLVFGLWVLFLSLYCYFCLWFLFIIFLFQRNVWNGRFRSRSSGFDHTRTAHEWVQFHFQIVAKVTNSIKKISLWFSPFEVHLCLERFREYVATSFGSTWSHWMMVIRKQNRRKMQIIA